MKLVYGVGLNDTGQPTAVKIGGVRVACNYYSTWREMLGRCYSPRVQAKNPSYVGCTVCEEWHSLSKFKAWMQCQDWEGKQLDKDLLFQGNKIYGPFNCIFVSTRVNNFLTRGNASRGRYPIGVNESRGRFKAYIRTGKGSGPEYLGTYSTPCQAHAAWLERKRELAIELAGIQSDPRIAAALLSMRYEDF